MTVIETVSVVALTHAERRALVRLINTADKDQLGLTTTETVALLDKLADYLARSDHA